MAATGAAAIAGAPDADAITCATGVPVARRVGDGDRSRSATATLEVIAIAGHTPGSIALLYDDPDGHPHLFTGDSLFPGGVGATNGDARRSTQLIADVETQALRAAARRHLVLPRARQRLGPRRRATHLAEWRARGW